MDKKEYYNKECKDNKVEVKETQKKDMENKKEFQENKIEIQENKKEIKENKKEIQENKKEIQENKKEVKENKKEIKENKMEFKVNKKEFEEILKANESKKFKVMSEQKNISQLTDIKNEKPNRFLQAKNTIFDFVHTVGKDIKDCILHRMDTYHKRVNENSKEGDYFDLLNHMEEWINHNKCMRYIMPFIEFVFIFYQCILFTVIIVSSTQELGYEVFSLFPLILCSLCFIKRKYAIAFLGLLSMIFERIYVLKRTYDYRNMIGDRLSIPYWIIVLETFILIYLCIKLIEIWYQSEEGKKIRYHIAKALLSSVEESKDDMDKIDTYKKDIYKRDIYKKEFYKKDMDNYNYIPTNNTVHEANKDGIFEIPTIVDDTKVDSDVLTLDEEVLKQLKDNINSDLALTKEIESE